MRSDEKWRYCHPGAVSAAEQREASKAYADTIYANCQPYGSVAAAQSCAAP